MYTFYGCSKLTCIMNAKGLSHDEAIVLLSGCGVLDYLARHFEILHTQSSQWIVEDI